MSLPGLKRGKWISAAIACELPREVSQSQIDYFGPASHSCACGGTFDAYQTHDDDGKPSGWYLPYHPKGGDEEAREAIEKRGNEAVEEAIQSARIDALEYVVSLCQASEQLTFYSEAYRGAFRDMRVSATASIERLKRGDRMESTSTLMDSDSKNVR